MEKVTKTARTLLMVAVMIASAILPMVPEAAELRDEARTMGASISTDVTSVTLDEGGWTMYEVSLDEAPDGTLVITPSSDNPAVTVDPSYIKFTKANWDTSQWVYVDILDTDDDGADTTATITHSISGTDTVFATAPGDVSVTGTDYDTDTDGDGLHDGLDTDDDGDGVDDTAEVAGCELLADCDGDLVNDDTDAFITDATEDTDTDGDGTGDNADAFPSDATEDTDTDGDGTGDNADAFPDDACADTDTDGDGSPDSVDDTDADADGAADCVTSLTIDAFPTDATEDTDTDGDGTGDNADAFPDDATEDTDSDGDGVGDNADAFDADDTEDTDDDGDGVGNNSDAFPDDATEDTDTDGDGTGDNADTDDDGDGVDDTAEDAGCALLADCDGDGVTDDLDAFDTDANATTDTDGDGDADDISVTGAVFDFDFEDGSLPTAVTWELSQCTGSDSSCVAGTSAGDWTVSDDTPIDGTYSLLSGDLSTNYENTNISVTFTSAEGTMSFDYQISSLCRDYTSTYYDGFRLYVDGVLVENPSDGGTACSNGVWGGVETVWPAGTDNGYDTSHAAYSATHFMCADGSQGFSNSLLSWVGDNYNDCSDGSDEDSSYTAGWYTAGIEGPVSGTHEQDLSAGTHTVLFQFHGGTSSAAGLSVAWIDNLVIPVAAGTVGSVGPTTTTDGTSLDNDDDDDGYSDVDETTNCESSSDPLDAADMPLYDNDGDYSCDAVDDDDDDDGVLDADEADGSALDLDGDGTADGINCANVTDCDGDGVGDATDTHPVDPSEQTDMDGDGIGDNGDSDRDGDGYMNSDDAFPDDDTEWSDNDGDGTGDNADLDDDTCPAADGADTDNDGTADATCGTFTGFGSWVDADNDGVQDYDFYPGDGVADVDDWDPTSPAESADNDGDGWGDNADYDDDDDGIADDDDDDMDGDGFDNDDEDTNCVGGLSDPQNGSDTPADMDGDGICDALDIDMDGDGTNGTDQGDGAVDAFDDDACADTDTDGDGMPDTLVAGCTTTLTEDDDDDFDASNAPTFDFYIWIDTDYYYSEASVGVYDYSSGSATTLLAAFYPSGSSMELLGTVTATDDIAVYGFDSYGDGFGTVYVADSTTTILGAISVTGSSGDAVFLFSDYVSSTAWDDAAEVACGSDPADANDQPTDTDGDNLCDDIQDDDNDDDGWTNDEETTTCVDSTTSTGTDPLDDTDAPSDNDADGTCDYVDTDDDDDGTLDADDAFSTDACADTDTDGDGSPDSVNETDADADGAADCVTTLTADTDDDDDGTLDADDAFSTDACADTDTDGDGSPDSVDETDADSDGAADCVTTLTADTDDDDDGVLDADEEDGSGLTTPLDCTILADCDGDGVGDELENTTCAIAIDCDGDGVNDDTDAFDLDATETTDTDGDGTGDVADTDDDGDGYSDADETTNCDVGTYASTSDELNGSETPADMDLDGTCDALDNDIDGDNIPNPWDQCPTDANGYIDTDVDGLCDGDSDPDDDGDTYDDDVDAFPLDGDEWLDTDGDGVGNNGDADDDDDGTDDQGDECPLDASGITDNDGDGACDESDTDDDDDTVLDVDEEAGCQFDQDCDGDGVADAVDAFDNNADATLDNDGDGMADSFDSNAPAAVTYTIDTQSYGDLTVLVYASGSAVADCVLDTTGPGGSGFDYPATDGSDPASTDSDSCTVTSTDGLWVVVENNAYITYYGAVFGYNTPNIDISVDGASVASESATYTWYTSTNSGDTVDVYIDLPAIDGVWLDFDDDDDGYFDADEDTNCVGDGGDSLDSTAMPADNDLDGICDYLDIDDDDDGYSDEHEADCGTDSMLAGDVSDFDGDGVCDSEDADDDADGSDDDDDWAPYDSSEWADTDNDGVGDNEDDDADGDGTPDSDDSDPTDRCSSMDTDGDGLTDSYDDCSTMGFYTTLDSDAGDNAGEGFDDGDMVGITDDTTSFWGAADGDQWFSVPDTDGVFRFYADHATGVSAIGMWFAISSTDWEEEDYFAAYWVGDDGVTTSLGHSTDTWGDIDDCWCEGFWFSWVSDVPSEDGYLMGEFSSDSDAEIFGLDNIAYFDNNWETLEVITFEDSVEDMGVYMTPSSPSLLAGTYTIDIADSYGDGGQSATVTHEGTTLCSITTDTNGVSDSCTFSVTGFSNTDLNVVFTSDLYASEGSMDITFPDGTVSSFTPSASYASDSYSFAHTGTEIFEQEGDYTVTISDPGFGDGGHAIEVYFEGENVCSIGMFDYSVSDSCTFTGIGFSDAVLQVDIDSDSYAYEGQLDVSFPDGTTATETWSADTSFSYTNHSGTDVMPVAGEVMLSNGHGATVSLDVSNYHTGTVDDDDDDDGWGDADDAFPTDDSEWDDMDGDGIGSNADNDDDGDGTNDGWDDFPRHAHADTDTDGDGMPDEIGWIDGEIGDDFELGNFSGMDDYSANGWDRSGDSLFGLASGTAFDGYAARAGIISDNESSTLELEIYTSEGYVSFDYMVSSEERYDTLSFSIDGMEYMAVSGQDYHWEFVCTTAGSYTDLAWEDSSLNDGSIPGNWVNDGFADCGDSDGDGTSDDEGLNNWYSMVEGSFETWVDEGDHTFTWTYAKDGSASAGSDRAYFDNVVIPYGIMGEGECADNTDLCNIEDLDDDEDGLEDLLDDCPTEAGEQIDTDGDGWCDNSDADDDNDGVYDYNDAMPLDPNETTDFDGDGIGDNADTDDDNDGCLDEDDALPYDDSDCYDLDGDGVGDTADPDDDGDNVMDVDDPFPEDGSAWLDTDGDGIADYTGDPPFDGTFEGGAIPMGFVTYGDADWFVCDANTCIQPPFAMPITGAYSAQSGDIPDQSGGATTTLEWSGETLAGDITFAYVTSSETNWDFLRFIVDGSIVSSWSGQTSGTYTHSVAAGNHTIQWQYYKDSIISSFDDTAWVDDIELPVSQQVFQDDTDDDNDGVYDEMDLDPMDPCVALDTDGDLQPDTVLTGLFDMSGTGDEAFIVNCDDTEWIEDWDDDGDGWSDDEEMMCGSNHLDGDEYPWDFDGDWVCDALDDDLDGDGAINPVDGCGLFLEWGETEAFIDCIADGFHAVDADGDGDASQMELIHAWTFQWDGGMDDGDDDWDDEMTFFCGDGSEIPFEWINDNITDCADGADEQQFDADGNPINWFDCNDGSTVWIYQVNDGLADCPDGEDEADYYWDMDEGSDDEMGTMSHDGTNHTDDGNDSEDWDDTNGSDDDDMDEDMVCYNLVNHAMTNDSAESCVAYGWFENASFDGMNFTGCYNTVSHEITSDDQGTCESYMWVTASGGPDDGGPDDGGPDDEEPEEPEMWPSPEDFEMFNAEFWGFVSAWDADNSSSMSFDEFWQFITDTEDDFDFANPGWSEDTTEWDQFPYDYTEQVDTDMDGMGDNSDPDDDGDGTPDSQDAFPLDATEDADLDGDGIGDNSDNDTDGDGIDNDQDDFDSDPGAAADNDQDGIDDASDTDDDNDLVPDVADWAPMDPSEQYDTDGDGIGDNADTDDDDDGVLDDSDAFPLDDSESSDNDNDGVGDNADPDDDNDGTPDDLDVFPTDANEQRDYDKDGIGDVADPDRDEDGYLNSDDAFPMNENEWMDTDGDNVGDNADSDIDGDSVENDDDWAPTDASEWDDTDGDGIGDNADDDDDGDGVDDVDKPDDTTDDDWNEYSCGTDSKNSASVPSDFDGDGICDALDDTDDRAQADKDANAQEAPGFTPGFASVLAVVSLLGAAMLGRRKED